MLLLLLVDLLPNQKGFAGTHPELYVPEPCKKHVVNE